MNGKSVSQEIEVSLPGKIPDQLKRDIEDLWEKGFDPEKIKCELQQQKAEEEKQANLLLPQSCLPKIEELVSMSDDLSDEEFEARLRKVFDSVEDFGNVALEFTSLRDICICERVLREYQPKFKERGIRALIHPRMREAVLAYSSRASR